MREKNGRLCPRRKGGVSPTNARRGTKTWWFEESPSWGAGLHPPSAACAVREKQGQPVVSDGPFVETKEVLGGFEMIQCRDRSEAIAVAQTFPALRVGFTVEVRSTLSDEDLEKMIGA
jgi:hypothetical protein